MNPNILYKAKSGNNWIEGYPVIKNNELYLFEKESNELIKISKETLCKNVYKQYYENDVFEFRGYKWVISYEETIHGYQLTRKDPKIHFTHFLPLSNIKEAKYLGNIIDSPNLVI